MVKGPNGAVPQPQGMPYVVPGTNSNVLTSNANQWKSLALPGGTLPAASTAGNLLTSNGSSWASTPNKVPDAGVSGNILTSDGANWQSQTPSSPLPAVGSSGNVLTSNGAVWSSQPVPTELPVPGTSGNLLASNGSAWTSVADKLPAPGTLNNILKSDGLAWTSAAPPPAELPTPDTSGNLLTSNGSAWLSTPNKVPDAGAANNRLISNGTSWYEGPKTVGTAVYFSSGGLETLTLTPFSEEYYVCEGDFIGTILLPDTNTMTRGRQFKFQNNGDMTHINLKLSDGTSFTTIPQNDSVTATCVLTVANVTSSWKIEYLPFHSTIKNIMVSDGTKWTSAPNPLPLPGTVGNTLTSNGGDWLSTPNKVPDAGVADNRLISNGSSWTQSSKTPGTHFTVAGPGSTTLTNTSTEFWYVNSEVDPYTFILPNVSTMTIGRQFKFSNLKTNIASSNLITIKNHDLDILTTLYDGETGTFTCINLIYNDEGWAIEKTFNFPAPVVSGHVLTSDGDNWISQALPVELPSPSSVGNVLTATGTSWISGAISGLLPAPPLDTIDVVLKSNGGGAWYAQQLKVTVVDTTDYTFIVDGPSFLQLKNITGSTSIYLPSADEFVMYIGKEFTVTWDGSNDENHTVSIYTGALVPLLITTIKANETIKFTNLNNIEDVANWKIERSNQYALPPPTGLNKYLQTQSGSALAWNESMPISYDGIFTPTFTLFSGLPSLQYTYNRFWFMKTIPYSTSEISSDFDVKMFVDFTFIMENCTPLNNTPAWIQLPNVALAKYTQGCTISITTINGDVNKIWDGVIYAGESQIKIENGNGVPLAVSFLQNLTFNAHFSYTATLV